MSKQAVNKITIINGASAGVIVTFNSDPYGAEETVSAIERSGGAAVALPLDVGRSESFSDFVDRATAEMRRL